MSSWILYKAKNKNIFIPQIQQHCKTHPHTYSWFLRNSRCTAAWRKNNWKHQAIILRIHPCSSNKNTIRVTFKKYKVKYHVFLFIIKIIIWIKMIKLWYFFMAMAKIWLLAINLGISLVSSYKYLFLLSNIRDILYIREILLHKILL